jgi:hypothetical protein
MISLLNPIRFIIIQRLIPISAGRYLRALAPAASGSIALALVYFLTEILLQGAATGIVRASAASVTSAAAYVVFLRVAWPDDFRRQLDFARLVVRGDPA